MPNIEIHGIGSRGKARKEIFEIKDSIRTIFYKKPFSDDIVITIVEDNAENLWGDPRPFLRVVSTHEEEHSNPVINLVIQGLKQLDMDIEVLILSAFHKTERE